MNMHAALLRFVMSFVLVLLTVNSLSAGTATMAMLSLEPNPFVSAVAGETVLFEVWLHDYQPESDGDAIISFGLNIAASDPVLTGADADFSGFNFILDSGLSGIIGGGPGAGDISDDGRVDISTDLAESGIVASDVLLGSLAVVAPDAEGSYLVDFEVNPSSPINEGGTFLLIDDVNFSTLPGDGDLTVLSSMIVVVPEPSTVVLLLFAMLAPRFHRRASPHIASDKVGFTH